ncbi:MAG: hypothetical protein WDA25_06480 [Paracoccaceae bacterium]
MLIKTIRAGWIIGIVLGMPLAAGAQDGPLSVIDWLSDSIATPAALPLDGLPPFSGDIATSALPEAVTVSPLDLPTPDAIGLLRPARTGLPAALWGPSSSADIARQITGISGDMLPSARALFRTILLAELAPPHDSTPGSALFLARVDALLALGLLEDADALIERLPAPAPEVFRRQFDSRLLLGSEDAACARLRAMPDLSPTFPTRIFCLARSGDWAAAAVTLEIATALGMFTESEDDLLARFLHPEFAEQSAALPPPAQPSPLMFRIYEAIGEPLPTATLPLAFAQADLRANIGWKAQIEAAERLVRAGTLPPERLHALYTQRRPAASGGIWDRVAALQRIDAALAAGDRAAIEAALPAAWRDMAGAGLDHAFAALYGERLARMELPDDTGALAFRIGLLSPAYETLAKARQPASPEETFLIGLARGNLADITPPNAVAAAIAEGFTAPAPSDRLAAPLAEGRLGEVILRALELLESGAQGNLDDLAESYAVFRAVGLEDMARRSALELLLLERRG